MIHLPPLPGYPESKGIDSAVRHALTDLRVLEQAGVHGVLIENEYDRPHRITAEAETIAAMTAITQAVVQESKHVIVGCEILLNDPKASLAVARMSGADFIRTDYFVDAMTRPGYGEFAIDADDLVIYRSAIGADDILILADIQVKYATMITKRPLSESAQMACEKQADAIIVTGDLSGDAPLVEHLREAASGVAASGQDTPVLIGSGLDAGNASELLVDCDGAIVGTALMRNKIVDAEMVNALMQSLGS
jgi:membrane complex biogenesis BtpA family protein